MAEKRNRDTCYISLAHRLGLGTVALVGKRGKLQVTGNNGVGRLRGVK